MRSLLAGELEEAQAWGSEYHVKLEVQNGSGTWIDVGAALGKAWIVNVTWGEHRDTAVAAATFTIVRNIGDASLAPLMTASVLNVDDALDYAPLLNIGRLMRAFTATMAQGVALDPAKYRPALTGRIDDVFVLDDGEGRANMIMLPCSDLGAWLMDLQIETEGTEYGNPDTPPELEDVLQAVIDDNIPVGEPSVTLVKQSSSLFGVTGYRQGETKLLEGLRTLVLDSVGEDLRYRFDASHVSQLMWFNPDRTRVTVDATFTAYLMRRVDLSLANIRNAGSMSYTPVTGTAGVVTATDAPSIADYRRRFFRLPSSEMLTSEAEAQSVIDTVVNDLSGPPAEAQAELPFCWFVQLYDRYTFEANGKQYDEDQTFAVGGYQHTIENGRGSTVLTPLTARIVGAYAAWQRRIGGTAPLLTLVDFKKIDETDTTVTWGWIAPYPSEVWAGYVTFPAPAPADLWEIVKLAVAPLPSGTTSITLTKPAPEYQTYLQVEPRTFDLVPGEIRRVELNGPARDTVPLLARARVTATTATTLTVRVAVADPYPQGSNSVSIAWQNLGTGGVTPTSPQTVTPAATITEAAGTYIDFTITRGTGTGSGRVTFTATATGRVSDSDAVDVAPSRLTGGGSTPSLGSVHAFWNGSNSLAGTDTAGIVTLNKTATPATQSNATQFKVTFAVAYATAPFVLLNHNAPFGSGAGGDFVIANVTTTDFTVEMKNATILATGAALYNAIFYYTVIG